ncbi:MAG TPA: methylated-DNA--[protein]-cysteine S-methyltransferase [Candidatus Dormibacteraeota bacterium]
MTVADGVLERSLEQFRRRAEREGLVEVAYTTMDTPIGTLLLAATPAGLVRIAFAEEVEEALIRLSGTLSPRLLELPGRLHEVRRQLDRYFSRRLHEFDLTLDRELLGPFVRRVLERTAAIPYGSCASYSELARQVGSPRAARAVGNAVGANPIPVVIPCHRVLRTGGALGGYGGGLDRKRFLLSLEGALR